ncbi:MAG TPA: nickel pincer cofactor biosynthesis protein LarC [Candidatus Elarobacter sp.]|nr:nickel pincer cofactor biosynthesis protein LarC [Candidatus Elarobacter sp.]
MTHSPAADTIKTSTTGLEQGRQFPRQISMKLAYFDCFSGISGDMTLGALVDAGCDAEQLRSGLRGLQVPGWELSAEKVWKNGMAATYVKVTTEDQSKHRSLSAILEILQKSQLTPEVRHHAAEIFVKLGEAEARVHDVPIEKIHFHEVGAVDAIVDIVGACIGFHALGIEKFACSALNVGGGTAKMAHGVLPVPAPATANLLQGKPTYSNGVQRELVTPTGAAIVATLCDSFGPQPAMSVTAIGYGAGTADLEGQPNVVRIMIGEVAEKTVAGFDEEIAVIEANLDDMNPQIYGYFLEKALAAGALDVYTTPVQMKKNRPGTLLTVLCKPQDTNALMSLIFAETTTFGARTYRAQRRTLPREFVSVATNFGDVHIKISRVNGRILHVAPEYDDCRKLAVEKNVPLQRVISEALRAYETSGKTN